MVHPHANGSHRVREDDEVLREGTQLGVESFVVLKCKVVGICDSIKCRPEPRRCYVTYVAKWDIYQPNIYKPILMPTGIFIV
jgi:hypothetical protein